MNRDLARGAWLLALLAHAGCGGSSEAPTTPAAQASSGGAERAHEPEPGVPISVRDVGLKTPESALHDPRADVYLVSNIDGSLLERDDRAFISRVRPDGSVEKLKWIDAERPDRLVFVERWESPQALQAHFAVPESRAFAREIGQLAVAPPSIEIFNASAVRS